MSRSIRQTGLLLGAALLLVVLRVFVAQSFFSDSLAGILSPISSAIQGIAYGDEAADGLDEDGQQLALETEVAELRKLQGLPPEPGLNKVGADVIGKSVQSYRRSLRVNRGSEDGLAANNLVMSGGFVVGIIDNVNNKSSSVLLIGDPDFRLAGIVEASEVQGIIKTTAEGVVFDRVNARGDGLENKLILSSGLSGFAPPGLPIGRVAAPLHDESAVFGTFGVRYSDSVAHLRFVQVVVNE